MNGVALSVADSRSLRSWLVTVVILVLVFAYPLYDLIRFSLQSNLYSHIVLIPLVSGYFAWKRRHGVLFARTASTGIAGIPIATGVCLLIVYMVAIMSGMAIARVDALAFTTLSFLLLLIGAIAWFFGWTIVRSFAFPLGFLVFMVPMPEFLEGWVETVLQYGSADAAYIMFKAFGTPVFRQGLAFQLPNFFLQVAPECSGIHSTLALLITSIVAGQYFLASPWKRAVLSVSVLPLALLRNGFRVFTIGELCVHVSPDMANSYIHRQGGPIFFALSLIPFSLLLVLLMKIGPRNAGIHAQP